MAMVCKCEMLAEEMAPHFRKAVLAVVGKDNDVDAPVFFSRIVMHKVLRRLLFGVTRHVKASALWTFNRDTGTVLLEQWPVPLDDNARVVVRQLLEQVFPVSEEVAASTSIVDVIDAELLEAVAKHLNFQ